MDKKTSVALFAILMATLVVGCVQTPSQNFKVDYYATYSSGGGDRILNITYFVEKGTITSCDGTYSFPPSQSQQDAGIFENNVEPCDVQKLTNPGSYNVPVTLITSVSPYQKTYDEVTDGPSFYRYRITIE